MKRDLVIIGGGSAGLASAIAAKKNGTNDILVIEREDELGGVLKQCVHSGFGLTRFGENLTGPEYAHKFIDEARSLGIEVLTGTFVQEITPDKRIKILNANGVSEIEATAVILAMGCRERSKGALNIAGTRPAGIFSAGTAQRYVNIEGLHPAKRVVILGSGDIGLIMARRLTLEGAKVLCVAELMPYSSGLKRNIEQCLNDFGIPLYLSHTVVDIEGDERVTGVTIAKVDDATKRPIPGTEMHFDCDTVLFSVGLIPENELTRRAGIKMCGATKGAEVDERRETSVEGVFACGNVLHVHDLVDFVSEEAELAGKAAAEYIRRKKAGEVRAAKEQIQSTAGEFVSYVLPQKINKDTAEKVKVYFRVRGTKKNCTVVVDTGATQKRLRKIAVAPGEMESVILTPAEIAAATGLKISVED